MFMKKVLFLSFLLLVTGIATAKAQEPEETTTTTTEVVICQEVNIPEAYCQHIPEESPLASFIEANQTTTTTATSSTSTVIPSRSLARTGTNADLSIIGFLMIFSGGFVLRSTKRYTEK